MFALGSANVEDSRAMNNFAGLFANIINYPNVNEDYEKMWVEGIREIYGKLYEYAKNVQGCVVEIIDTEGFYENTYKFGDPSKIPNFSVYSKKSEIFKEALYSKSLMRSHFSNFVNAKVASRVRYGDDVMGTSTADGSAGIFNSDFLANLNSAALNGIGKLVSGNAGIAQEEEETLSDSINSLSYDEGIMFNNIGGIFNQHFIPTTQLKDPKNISKLKEDDNFFGDFGLQPLLCLCESAKTNPDSSRLDALNETCPGFLVAIYNGTKNNFRNLIIKRVCSKEINDLKIRIAIKYLKDLLELNPNVNIRHLCSDPSINFLGNIYLKKSKFYSIKKICFYSLI